MLSLPTTPQTFQAEFWVINLHIEQLFFCWLLGCVVNLYRFADGVIGRKSPRLIHLQVEGLQLSYQIVRICSTIAYKFFPVHYLSSMYVYCKTTGRLISLTTHFLLVALSSIYLWSLSCFERDFNVLSIASYVSVFFYIHQTTARPTWHKSFEYY